VKGNGSGGGREGVDWEVARNGDGWVGMESGMEGSRREGRYVGE